MFVVLKVSHRPVHRPEPAPRPPHTLEGLVVVEGQDCQGVVDTLHIPRRVTGAPVDVLEHVQVLIAGVQRIKIE